MKSAVKDHFNLIASDYIYYKNKQKYYYSNLKKLIDNFIPKNSEVLEFGCGTGHMLAHLSPKYGYGFDISGEMIKIAKRKYKKYKNLNFSSHLPQKKFDYIFMCDVIEHIEDLNSTFKQVKNLMHNNSVFICTMANPKLEPLLMVAEKLKMKMPEGNHYRIPFREVKKILKMNNLKVKKHDFTLLIPIKIPFVTYIANTYLEKYLKKYAFIEYFTAIKI